MSVPGGLIPSALLWLDPGITPCCKSRLPLTPNNDSVCAPYGATGLAMMRRHKNEQAQLFYSFRLDEVVPDDHLVREIAEVLDLSWVHAELAPYYPKIGRPSIDPALMIRS